MTELGRRGRTKDGSAFFFFSFFLFWLQSRQVCPRQGVVWHLNLGGRQFKGTPLPGSPCAKVGDVTEHNDSGSNAEGNPSQTPSLSPLNFPSPTFVQQDPEPGSCPLRCSGIRGLEFPRSTFPAGLFNLSYPLS